MFLFKFLEKVRRKEMANIVLSKCEKTDTRKKRNTKNFKKMKDN